MGFNMAIDDLCHSTQKSPDVPWCKEISNLKRQSFLKYLDELESKLQEAFSIKNKLVFVDINVDETEHVYPMQVRGGAMNEMILSKPQEEKE